jgi:hypothetical protein
MICFILKSQYLYHKLYPFKFMLKFLVNLKLYDRMFQKFEESQAKKFEDYCYKQKEKRWRE